MESLLQLVKSKAVGVNSGSCHAGLQIRRQLIGREVSDYTKW